MARKSRLLLILILVVALGLAGSVLAPPQQAKAAVPVSVTVVASTHSLPADFSTLVTVTVKVWDGPNGTGNGVGPGILVNILPALPAGLVGNLPNNGSTDATGVYVIQIKAHASAANTGTTFSAFIPSGPGAGLSGSDTQAVNFTTPNANPGSNISANPANPTGVPADGQNFSTITVVLTSLGGDPLKNKTVQLAAFPNTGVIIPGAQTTDASGTATFQVKSTVVALVSFNATVTNDTPPTTLASNASVNFVQPQPDGTKSTIQTSSPGVDADGVSTATITVTVKDVGGNTLTNVPVTLSPIPGTNLTVLPSLGPQNTNSFGIATFTVSSTVAHTVSFQAIAGGIAIVPSPPVNVTFQVPPADDTKSTVTAAPIPPATVPADGVTTATVTITLKDKGIHPAPNKSVTINAISGGPVVFFNSLNQQSNSGTTNAAGVATFTVTSKNPSTVTFQVNDSTDGILLSNQPQVIFAPAPGNANQSSLQPDVSTAPADNTSKINFTATLRDLGGNPVANKAVSVIANPNTGLTITAASGTTAADGTFKFFVTSTAAGNYNFTVNDTTDGVVFPASPTVVTFALAPVNNSQSSMAPPTASVVADNVATTTLTVTLKDQGGNPAVGRTVKLDVQNGTLAAFPGITVVGGQTGTTVAGGTFSWTIKSSVAYSTPPAIPIFNVTVTQPDNSQLVLTSTSQVTFTTAPATAGTISTLPPGTAVANGGATPAGFATVKVSLTNASGQPVDTKVVQLKSVTPGVIIPSPIGATGTGTDPKGTVTFQVASSAVGTATFTAVDNTDVFAIPGSTTVNFTAAAPGSESGATSTIAVSPTTVNADGASFTTISVVLHDPNNTVVVGAVVTPVANTIIPSAGYTVTAINATTDNTGTAKFKVTATQAGTITFTATTSVANITQPPANPPGQSNIVTFNPVGSTVSSTLSTISAAPSIQTADGASVITITVTIKDSTGTALGGQTVTLTGTAGLTVAPTQNPTNAGGVATFNLTTFTPGPYTIGASAGGVTLAQTAAITFNPPGCDVGGTTVTITSATNQPADGSTAIVFDVAAKTAGNVVIVSPNLTFSTTRGAVDTLNPVAITGTAAGTATGVKITSITAGTGNILVKVNNCLATAQPSFTFFATSSGVSPVNSFITSAPASALADNAATITVSVNLRDSGNFVVGSQPMVTLTVTGGPTVTTANPVAASAGGVATFTIKSGTPGTFNVSATVGGVTITNSAPPPAAPTQATVTFTPLPGSVSPTNSTVVLTGSPAAVGGSITVTITVRDTSNAVMPGKSVTITAPGATINPAGAQTTGAGGQVIFTLTSATAQSVVVTATAAGVPLSTTPTAVWQNAVASATNSCIQVNPTSVAATGSVFSTVTVTLRDASNVVVPGKSVTLAPNPSGSLTGSLAPVTTGAGGTASWNIGSTAPQTVIFTATDTTDGVAVTTPCGGGSNIVTYTSASGLDPVNSHASANPGSVPADGTTSTISVNIRTIGGTNVAGASVSISGSPANGVVVDALTKTTDANGNVTFLVHSSVVQAVTFQLSATFNTSSIILNDHPTVNFTTASTTGGTVVCTSSTISSNFSSIPADNNTSASITITLKNSTGGGVSGQTITISGTNGAILSPSSAISDSNGNAAFTLKANAQGSATITALSGNCVFTLPITFTAPGTQPGSAGTGAGTGTGAANPNGTGGAALIQPPNTGPAVGVVIAYRLRVRTGPSLRYHILGLIKGGTQVVLVARNARGTWFQIQLNNGTAWVSAYYIRVKRLAYRHLPIIDNDHIPAAPNNENVQAVIPK